MVARQGSDATRNGLLLLAVPWARSSTLSRGQGGDAIGEAVSPIPHTPTHSKPPGALAGWCLVLPGTSRDLSRWFLCWLPHSCLVLCHICESIGPLLPPPPTSFPTIKRFASPGLLSRRLVSWLLDGRRSSVVNATRVGPRVHCASGRYPSCNWWLLSSLHRSSESGGSMTASEEREPLSAGRQGWARPRT